MSSSKRRLGGHLKPTSELTTVDSFDIVLVFSVVLSLETVYTHLFRTEKGVSSGVLNLQSEERERESLIVSSFGGSSTL